MKIGTYYYPEQWSRDEWTRDFDNIAKMGLQIVHLAEFAWGTIEPREGEYQLDWIDECLKLADERDLDVILCTPTAVIPAWLAEKHPDVLWTHQRFGGRRHANHLHPAYREASRRVTEVMADRFGSHPRVIGWQIDNEFNNGRRNDQSAITHAVFREWLRVKYDNDIEKLNAAWGCAFWNTYYSSFDQIKLPETREPDYRNQHECVDASRFVSRSFADYVKLQADVLKRRISSRWISTNFMPFHLDLNPDDVRDSLSLFSWDTYPISGMGRGFKDESFRTADPDGVAFLHDQMAGASGRWGLMEVQPGQINWSGSPVKQLPGAIGQLLWQAIAHQAEFITVYRFRQPRFGIEMWHDGLVQWDGVTPSAGGREFVQVIEELRSLDAENAKTYTPLARDESVPTIGVLHDHDQLWSYASLPQQKRWNQPKLVTQYHAAIERLGLHAAVTRVDVEWSKLPVLIVPGLQMADDATVEKLQAYVRGGGHLITTARSLTTDRNGQAPNGVYGHRLFDLIGSKITGYDALPEDTFGTVEMNGVRHPWGVWADLIEAGKGVQVLARYIDQFYAGTPAVVRKSHGSGSVTHVGAIDEGSLAEAVVEHVARSLKFEVRVIPDRTKLHRLAGGVNVFLNFGVTPVDAPADADAQFVIGGRHVPAAGVAVWRE